MHNAVQLWEKLRHCCECAAKLRVQTERERVARQMPEADAPARPATPPLAGALRGVDNKR